MAEIKREEQDTAVPSIENPEDYVLLPTENHLLGATGGQTSIIFDGLELKTTIIPNEEKTWMRADWPFITFVFGPPCVGKTTMCKHLAKFFGLHHLSFDDFLRGKADTPTCPLRSDIRRALHYGEPLSSEQLAVALRTEINGIIDTAVHEGKELPPILIDGFPNSVGQFSEYRIESKPPHPLGIMFLDCSLDKALQRYIFQRFPDQPDYAALIEFERRFATYGRRIPQLYFKLKYPRNSKGFLHKFIHIDAEQGPHATWERIFHALILKNLIKKTPANQI